MKVLVLGANGRVGSKVALLLLERGHSVVAAVHSRSTNVPKQALVCKVDIADRSSVMAALDGCDAVVCALSSWNAPDHSVLGSAMKTVVPAMHSKGVRRIVSISGDVARVEGETVPFFIRLFHVFAFGAIRAVITDSEKHIDLLRQSDLAWTVIRPGVMTSAQRPQYRLVKSHPLSLTIPRAAVVESIVDLIESGDYSGQAPFLSSK